MVIVCCAVSTVSSEIYIVGGYTSGVDVLDTATLNWKPELHARDMPEERLFAAAVVLKKKYLVVTGGYPVTGSCLIYDIWCNRWSSTPASMDMIEARHGHTATVLDRKIVVAGGGDHDNNELASVECIDADALLEYTPLHYPLPDRVMNRIFEIGKFERECIHCEVSDKPKAKKHKTS